VGDTKRAGLVFHVGRTRRRLAEFDPSKRIGREAAIRLACTLETLIVETLDGAGVRMKANKRNRLKPQDIKFAFEYDDDLAKLTEHVDFMDPRMRMNSRVSDIERIEKQLREQRKMKPRRKSPKKKRKSNAKPKPKPASKKKAKSKSKSKPASVSRKRNRSPSLESFRSSTKSPFRRKSKSNNSKRQKSQSLQSQSSPPSERGELNSPVNSEPKEDPDEEKVAEFSEPDEDNASRNDADSEPEKSGSEQRSKVESEEKLELSDLEASPKKSFILHLSGDSDLGSSDNDDGNNVELSDIDFGGVSDDSGNFESD